MDKIFNLGSVDQYHKLYGFETLNPLVSAIDLNEATRQDTTGTHSGESDRNGKGTYGRYRGYRQIAYLPESQYPQHFCRLFKKRVRCTPDEYRVPNNQ